MIHAIWLKVGSIQREKIATIEADSAEELRFKVAKVLRATADLIEVNADE